MNELVYLKNEQALDDSMIVAELFGKEHAKVMRSIDKIVKLLPKTGKQGMFIASRRKADDGQFHRMYSMNRDGFSLLVMGFTGKKALEQKLKYIDAFNQMDFGRRDKMNKVYINLSVLNDEIKEIYKKSCFGDWSCLDDVERLKLIEHDGFYIDHVIRECCLLNLRNYETKSEFDVHKWFKQNFKNVLGNDYEISDFKSHPKHIPDVWLAKESELIPVEIKLNAFTGKSLTQLKRYMDFYNTKNGIAVADGLECELPKNITFVDYKEWEKKGEAI